MSAAPPTGLRLERAGAVVTLTIDRPAVRNALAPATIRALREVVAGLEEDDGVLAVVLTGAGDEVFVAGGDLRALQEVEGAEAGRKMARLTQQVFARLEALEVPVIAAINGVALGGGTELAAACDIRIAAENASFGFKQIQMGIMPAWGLTHRLLRQVGRSAALDLLLTGRTLTACEAKNALYGRGDVLVHPVRELDDDNRTLARCSDQSSRDSARAPAKLAKHHVHVLQDSIGPPFVY